MAAASSARMTGGPSRTYMARPVARAMTAAAALAASTRVTTSARSVVSSARFATTATAATLGTFERASSIFDAARESGTVKKGASPGATDKVRVHYHGTLRDGSVFDSSVDRGQPAEFPLNRVIKCWTEGVAMMKVGGKSRLICPAAIAYGEQGRPGIPGGAALTFEVELLEIVQ